MAQLHDPAAANVAAWEDALDLDDSDIRFDSPAPVPFSRPSVTTASDPHQDKPPHPSHHHHRTPGPAAAVQDMMRPRSAARPPLSLGRGDVRATDADFLLSPWLSALQFLGKDRAWEQPGIRAIKNDDKLVRARLVAGVVTSCKPNGLGDVFLIIKDPTDSIGASIHKKVLLEGNNGHDISIGCAVILSNIAVFRPSRKSCYLNVTKGKVIKVLGKDCAAPFKQVISSSTPRSHGEGSTSNLMMKILGHEEMMLSNKEMPVTEVSREHRTHDSSNSTSKCDIYSQCSLGSNREGKLMVGDPHSKHTSNCSTAGHSQQNLSVPNIIATPKDNATTISGSLLNPKRAVSTASVSEWTDEQLSELFADY